MEQQNIRDFNNETYSILEGAAILKELNDRTKHSDEDFNSIAQLGTAIKELLSIIPYTDIEGVRCLFKKHPQNNNPEQIRVFEPYDFVINLTRANDMIWNFAQWIGGDQSNDENWIVFNYTRIEPIPE